MLKFIRHSIFVSICFFNQKTAYEMRISDWSSDVCSSDLPGSLMAIVMPPHALPRDRARACQRGSALAAGILSIMASACALKDPPDIATIKQEAIARKSVVKGKSVSGRVDLGGRRILKNNTNTK